MKIHEEFFEEYFTYCTFFKYNDAFTPGYPIFEFLDHFIMMSRLHRKQFSNEISEIFLEYMLPESSLPDIVLMFQIFSISKKVENFLFHPINSRHEWVKLDSLLTRSKLVNGISFHRRGNESIHIKSDYLVLEIIGLLKALQEMHPYSVNSFQAGLNFLRNHNKQLFNKNPQTHDLYVFSWSLLAYLNEYTQYKTKKNSFASNEQCRIIYTILNKSTFLNEKSDPVAYIREYLKKAQKHFSRLPPAQSIFPKSKRK